MLRTWLYNQRLLGIYTLDISCIECKGLGKSYILYFDFKLILSQNKHIKKYWPAPPCRLSEQEIMIASISIISFSMCVSLYVFRQTNTQRKQL